MTAAGLAVVVLLQVMAPTLPQVGASGPAPFHRCEAGPVEGRGMGPSVPAVGSECPGPLGLAVRSLLLPGWGQKVDDRGHWWVYAAAEAIAWGGGTHQRREGSRFRQAYRDLAWTDARLPVWEGPRRDGAWGYYERMAAWPASGRFDLSPEGEPLQPETDEGTYNGMVWRLARDLHLPSGTGPVDPADPSYGRALAYYRDRAVPPELRWDWEGAEESRARFRALIGRSDEAFRNATTFVGVALVNRFISGVEMWVSAHPGPTASLPVRVRSEVLPGAGAGRWELQVHLQGRRSGRPPSRSSSLAPPYAGVRAP